MAKVMIEVDETEVPLIRALLYVERSMRSEYGEVRITHEAGKARDVILSERFRIDDMLPKLPKL
jgi:hypothetical protein